MRHPIFSKGAGARGQSLVEFALVFPIFAALLFGVIDGGRLIYLNTVVSQAAREGARVAAVEASWIGITTAQDPSCVVPPAVVTSANPGAHVCPRDATDLQADVLAAANRMVAPFGPISSANLYIRCDPAGTTATASWTGVSCSSHSTGDLVSVRVLLTFTPLTPGVNTLIGTLTLSGSATMVSN